MSEVFKALSVEEVDVLKADAHQMGMSATDVADVIDKYGPNLLLVITSAIKNGLSFSFCLEMVKLFGPAVLGYIVDLFVTSKSMVGAQSLTPEMSMNGAMAEVLKRSNIEAFPPEVLNILLQKLLPWALEKYGQQIVSAIIESVVNNLKSESFH